MIKGYEKIKNEINGLYLPDKYALLQAKSGDCTMQIILESERYYLHSKYNPVKEGIELCKSVSGDYNCLLVFGLGMGYHITPLVSDIKKNQQIYVFEHDINIIKAAFENTDIETYLSKENVHFIYDENINNLSAIFAELLITEADDFILHRPSMRMNQGFERLVLEHILEANTFDIQHNSLKNIMILSGDSKYGAIASFEHSLSTAFRKMGFSVTPIEILGFSSGLKMVLGVKKGVKFVLSFCVLGLTENGDLLEQILDVLSIPFVFLSVDDPLFQINRPDSIMKSPIYTWVDRNRQSFYERFKEFYPNVRSRFLPHGGESSFAFEELFNHERQIDVLVTGTMTDNMNIGNILKKVSDNHRALVEEVAEYCLLNSSSTIEGGFEHIISKEGPDYSDKYLLGMLKLYGRLVYFYITAKRRYDTVKAALDGKMTITCYGTGWENTDLINYPNFIYKGEISYSSLANVYKESKIVLNTMSVIKDGAHERVFSSMLNGALCLTDYSKYLDEIFEATKEIVFYDTDALKNLPAIINRYIRNEKSRLLITEAAYKNARENHTWYNRAERILELLSHP